jgi:hypothetical protein
MYRVPTPVKVSQCTGNEQTCMLIRLLSGAWADSNQGREECAGGAGNDERSVFTPIMYQMSFDTTILFLALLTYHICTASPTYHQTAPVFPYEQSTPTSSQVSMLSDTGKQARHYILYTILSFSSFRAGSTGQTASVQ